MDEKPKISAVGKPASPPVKPWAKKAEGWGSIEEAVPYKEARPKLWNFRLPGVDYSGRHGPEENTGGFSFGGVIGRNKAEALAYPCSACPDPKTDKLLLKIPERHWQTHTNTLADPKKLKNNPRAVYMHRLALKRFLALSAAWEASTSYVSAIGPIKLGNAWRMPAFASFKEFHEHCARPIIDSYLGPEYGQGVATKTDTFPKVKRNRKCSVYKAFWSPHETGMAFDIGMPGLHHSLNDDVTNKIHTGAEQIRKQHTHPLHEWMKKNAHLYGVTPLYHESWHWEINMPLQSWQTGEDWITVDGDTAPNYAVRVQGASHHVRQKGVKRSKVRCPDKSILGRPGAQPAVNLKELPLLANPISGAEAGTEFTSQGEKRTPEDITQIIIHETAGSRGTVPSKRPNGDPKAVATLEDREPKLSIHFIIDEHGTVTQHVPLLNEAFHARSHNPMSVGVDLVNWGFISPAQQKSLVKKTDGAPYHVLIKGFKHSKGAGMLLNTQAQCRALWKLIKNIVKELFPDVTPGTATTAGYSPSIKLVAAGAAATGTAELLFPCSIKKDSTGNRFQNSPRRDARHAAVSVAGGILAHDRFGHSDGLFAEYYCLGRYTGLSDVAAWKVAVGAAATAGQSPNVNVTTPIMAQRAGYGANGESQLAVDRAALLALTEEEDAAAEEEDDSGRSVPPTPRDSSSPDDEEERLSSTDDEEEK